MTEVGPDVAHATVLLDLRRYDEAVTLLVRIVAAEPADSTAWCLLAASYLGAGRYQEAAATASRAITLAPSDDWPYRLASTARRHLGDITAALAAANEACKLAPHEWRAYVCLAQAQLATEVHFTAAERAAATALKLAPLEPDAHYIAGQVSYAQERWKAARAHQERALSLDPTHSGALNELGRIRAHRGDLPGAARYFIQAVRSAPRVSTYAGNVEVAVRRVMALTLNAAYFASTVLLVLTMATSAARRPVGIGYTVIVAPIAAYGAVQLRRMPPEIRPLLRTRRVSLALRVVYGTVLIAMITAAVTPARALPGVMLAATVLILASSLVARVILRRRHVLGPCNRGDGSNRVPGVPRTVVNNTTRMESSPGRARNPDDRGCSPSRCAPRMNNSRSISARPSRRCSASVRCGTGSSPSRS
jgi:tetratricopeptide (TPR) repeat protein